MFELRKVLLGPAVVWTSWVVLWRSKDSVADLQAGKDDRRIGEATPGSSLASTVGFVLPTCPRRLENYASLALSEIFFCRHFLLPVLLFALPRIWQLKGRIELMFEIRLWSQTASIGFLAPLLTSCVNMGMLLGFPVTHFSHRWKEA